MTSSLLHSLQKPSHSSPQSNGQTGEVSVARMDSQRRGAFAFWIGSRSQSSLHLETMRQCERGLFIGSRPPGYCLLFLSLEIDDLVAIVPETEQRQPRLNQCPVEFEPPEQQRIAPLLTPTRQRQRLDRAAQDARDAEQLPLPNAGTKLLSQTNPDRRCLVVVVLQLPGDDRRFEPFVRREEGAASSTAVLRNLLEK
jgi:hypothetical protein